MLAPHAAKHRAAADCGQPPRGVRSDLTTAAHAESGPNIDEPVTYPREAGAFICVHGHGRHPIGFGPGTPHPCSAAGCIEVGGLGQAIAGRLAARGIEINGIGAGACSDTNGDYDAWNMSVGVLDWKLADAAIATVDEELRARDAGGSFGVSVVGITCNSPE